MDTGCGYDVADKSDDEYCRLAMEPDMKSKKIIAKRRTYLYLTSKIQNFFAARANLNADPDEKNDSATELDDCSSEVSEIHGVCEWVTDSDPEEDPMPLATDRVPEHAPRRDGSEPEMWEVCSTFTTTQPIQVNLWPG